MVVARKRLPASSLKIVTGKQVLPEKAVSLLPEHVQTETKAEKQPAANSVDSPPLTQWNLPAQEERYLKCRNHDFL